MSSFYLEKWLHGIIADVVDRGTPSSRLPAGDRLISPARAYVEDYRDIQLRETLQYAFDKSSFYREQFDRNRLQPSDFEGFRDLEKFPFTEPGHLAQFPYRFLCTSQAEVPRPCIFVTSGTTGPRKQVFWTQRDLERIKDFMAAGIGTIANSQDTVQILLFDGRPNSQADLLSQGVCKSGAHAVVPGAEPDAEKQFGILEEARSTILFGYTGQLYRISKELEAAKHNLRARGIRFLFLAGEYLPAARRRELEAIWNCKVRTHYGLTEMGLGVAVECSAEHGYHFNEADLLLEIIDPRSGRRAKPGEEGELVFTTLTREAMPLIRYRTHDISRLIPEPCPCGAGSLLRFDVVRKRLDSIVLLADGAEMYPTLFDDLLFDIPDVIEYQVKLLRQEDKERLDFRIEIARERRNMLEEIDTKLRSSPVIATNIASGGMDPPRVELLPPGTLKQTDRAKKMIVDLR